ncbi:RNA polymerase-associated protein HepA [Methylococcus capsulatus str. Bath]|uniref:RNA polymerase-associated protein RapA n=1 Tax=Methylococcus capsulatus (strain ATCC 33009 / NCIMB 11132 / Bath) TaxID=243233 RepID=Q604K8_METCA|nr:RNA polymerase-associated protein RapA [Methylococcus capsulatus]AAU91421.1 RNA polymerase-associated protein HepA [Methylococcus capsulatus str. Bath]
MAGPLHTLRSGQRWISDTEPELGLGTVVGVEHDRVTVSFIASGERRIYAVGNAPLSRVRFAAGDRVESVDGWSMQVEEVEEQDGLLVYLGKDADGKPRTLEEIELNPFLQFNRPQDRLLSGQIDPGDVFRLRIETGEKLARLEQSPVLGLVGPRTALIPHQLYIAHEVASRHAPRVLLADEVGLGKTIEAGLIIHHRVLTGRTEKVLILVPNMLLHQWLVEMLRRFNLRFSLIGEDAYEDAAEEGSPFKDVNLALSSLDFILKDPERRRYVLDVAWDMVVIDEAHHLEWTPEKPSPAYAFVEMLARRTPGLLLLTATPEQLGKLGHFARLRLLDPDRFFDFEQFRQEEQEYTALAGVIDKLLDSPRLDADTLGQLQHFLRHDRADALVGDLNDPEHAAAARNALIQLLLDRHGTGRVLFRNTRNTVHGFPSRLLHGRPLPLPEHYRTQKASLEARLWPESARPDPDWWRHDPRVHWLLDIAQRLKPSRSKLLVICHRQQTAVDLENALRTLGGVRAAVFHEGMSIIARDRAAAWFAEEEEGAQVLVCSEIGSEGRNFQFAHHLVLFDLPLDPNLLEQRIGRLDRIGQHHSIDIHVPYFEDSAQEILFRWYHEGLDAFHRPAAAGAAVFARLGDELRRVLLAPDTHAGITLIQDTRTLAETIEAKLHAGRDRLLELNSCRPEPANRLVEAVAAWDRDTALWPWLEAVCDAYGVVVEEHSTDCYILRPGEHLRVPKFPELPEDGVTVTLSRDVALAREDMVFLSWEHPLVRGAIDLVLNGEHGNASLGFVSHPALASGQMLLETFHRIECPAPRRLQLFRFLPTTQLRTLLDHRGQDLGRIAMAEFDERPQTFEPANVRAFVRSQKPNLEKLLALAETRAGTRLTEIVADSSRRMLDEMTNELKRLAALRSVNPSVRQEELDRLKDDAVEMHGYLQAARLRLDAVRLLITV